MNVLINGASGYIGFHLVNEMLLHGHTVYAVCRQLGTLSAIERNERLNIIMTGQDELPEHIRGLSIDVWYQLLWDGARREKRADPILQIKNEIMSIHALKTAEAVSCGRIIFTGTVYEKFTPMIINNAAPNKHSFYIISKDHAHEMTYQLSKEMNIDYVWVRFCHPYGKFMDEGQLLPYAVKCFSEGLPTEFGSGENYFDIIPAEYLAAALRTLGEKRPSRSLYYIGSGAPRKLKEYLIKAAQICNYKLPVGLGKRKDDGLVFEKQWFDAAEFENEFEIGCSETFEEMIMRNRKMQ